MATLRNLAISLIPTIYGRPDHHRHRLSQPRHNLGTQMPVDRLGGGATGICVQTGQSRGFSRISQVSMTSPSAMSR